MKMEFSIEMRHRPFWLLLFLAIIITTTVIQNTNSVEVARDKFEDCANQTYECFALNSDLYCCCDELLADCSSSLDCETTSTNGARKRSTTDSCQYLTRQDRIITNKRISNRLKPCNKEDCKSSSMALINNCNFIIVSILFALHYCFMGHRFYV